MAAVINTISFPDFVSNSEIKWRKRFEEFPKIASVLYDIEDVSVLTSDESSFDTFSVAKKKEDGQDFAMLNVSQGYKKSWEIYEVGGMTKITWKMRIGNKYREIDQSIEGLATTAAKRMELDLTHRFAAV